MPVITMSTVTPHVVKNHKRFNKIRNQRNRSHQMFEQIQKNLGETVQAGWERHNQALQKGLQSAGQMADFHHSSGNTSLHARLGVHEANISANSVNPTTIYI